MILKINTITAVVADQSEAERFYTEVLGMRVRTDLAMGDIRWLEVAPDAEGTAIVLHKPFPGATPASGVILAAEDVDAVAARLREAGVRVEGPEDLPWGRQASFTDPDGNSYVLVASP